MVVPASLLGEVDAVARGTACSPRLLPLLVTAVEVHLDEEGSDGHVRLRTAGRAHRLDVRQLDASAFQVRSEAGLVDLTLVRTGGTTRRLTLGDVTVDVDLVRENGGYRVHLGGQTHDIERLHRTVVEATQPGMLMAYLCHAGQEVAAGDPLASLETMKLITTVRAPEDGRVGALLAKLHGPIERGTPLLELHPPDGGDLEVTVAADGGRLGSTGCVLEDLRACLLGYDVDAHDLAGRFRRYPADVAGGSGLVDREAAVLRVAADRVPPDRLRQLGGPLRTVLERWLRVETDGSDARAIRRILTDPGSGIVGWDATTSQLLSAIRTRLDEEAGARTTDAGPTGSVDVAGYTVEDVEAGPTCRVVLATGDDEPEDRRLVAFVSAQDLGPADLDVLARRVSVALARLRSAAAGWSGCDRPTIERLVVRGCTELAGVSPEDWRGLVEEVALDGAGLDLDALEIRWVPSDGPERAVVIAPVAEHGVVVHPQAEAGPVVPAMDDHRRGVLRARRFGTAHPREVVRLLTPPVDALSDLPPGTFDEHDLDEHGRLVAVDRPPGGNSANVVVGVITNRTTKHPEGMRRVIIIGDPTCNLGSLAEPECRRIIAALELAERLHAPVEWFAVSSGALISMESGTENMDWIAAVMRRLIEFTQAGGEVNIVVAGINVGGQPYWNAEATMLMHTRGILVMIPGRALVLTGKGALDHSGGVSADDNDGIGGVDAVMGPNGQAQYRAESLEAACDVLFRHYDHTYTSAVERFPRRAATRDPIDRDVREEPLAVTEGGLETVGDIFAAHRNRERKAAFDIRSVMRAVVDRDHEPLERWAPWRDAATSVVWDAHVGGVPLCLIGIEARHVRREGATPADGPSTWTSGTLFPASAKKVARAVNAASGNRPVVVLANLAGFDGSPESLRSWQLEYGAEIGRAVTNFDGPIVVCVLSRYHGGAFVVFSKRLNPQVEIAAVQGAYASVIGGAPAAAVVFGREVRARVEADPRVVTLREAVERRDGDETGLRTRLERRRETVHGEKLTEVADEYDRTHDVHRALRVGSIDRIIQPEEIRPYIADAVERGIARTLDSDARR